VRIYTKPRGEAPDLEEPIVLTAGRHGLTVRAACLQVRPLGAGSASLRFFLFVCCCIVEMTVHFFICSFVRLQIHRALLQNFKFCVVWGTSVKFSPQRWYALIANCSNNADDRLMVD
jgi:hypothetical protein